MKFTAQLCDKASIFHLQVGSEHLQNKKSNSSDLFKLRVHLPELLQELNPLSCYTTAAITQLLNDLNYSHTGGSAPSVCTQDQSNPFQVLITASPQLNMESYCFRVPETLFGNLQLLLKVTPLFKLMILLILQKPAKEISCSLRPMQC